MKTLCANCGSENIFNKKRCLCRKCYQSLYRSKSLPYCSNKTFTEKRTTLLKNLAEKYGFEAIGDMFDLTHKNFLTLADISTKYSVTRELVRQWHKKIFGQGYRYRQAVKKENRKEPETCINDPRRKVADYKDGLVKKGAIAETLVLTKCVELGYDVNPCVNRIVDLNINGYNVEVKSSYVSKKSTKDGKAEYHRYGISQKQLNEADFFVCYHKTTNSFFIIPKENLTFKKPIRTENGKHIIYISAAPTVYPSSKNSYWEFQEAWNLLLPATL